jgi:hypothetical protein
MDLKIIENHVSIIFIINVEHKKKESRVSNAHSTHGHLINIGLSPNLRD